MSFAATAKSGGSKTAQTAPQATGNLNGTAKDKDGKVMPSTTVQLRNVATGQLAGTTTSSAAGQFSFIGLNPATYSVEVVNATGTIVGTSAATTVTAGTTATVTVTASTAAAGAGGGGGAAGAAAGAGGAGGGLSTAAIVAAVAAAGGIATAVAVARNGSPSS